MNHVENRNLSGGTLNIPDWNLGPSTGYVWAISQCHVSVTIFRMGTSVRGGSVLARFSVWAFQSARSRSEIIFFGQRENVFHLPVPLSHCDAADARLLTASGPILSQ